MNHKETLRTLRARSVAIRLSECAIAASAEVQALWRVGDCER